MEKGKIRSITGFNGGGTIADSQGRILNFNSSGFVGRNRGGLKTGNIVWFERVGSYSDEKAINVRLC